MAYRTLLRRHFSLAFSASNLGCGARFMKLEEGEIEWKELAPPKYPLPTTWQEYQAVQDKATLVLNTFEFPS